jgi:hypothetical protein
MLLAKMLAILAQPRRANQRHNSARLTADEGRFAIVTNVRWDAVDAEVTTTSVTEAYGEVVWS